MTVLGNWVVFAALVASLLSAISYYRVASANAPLLRSARLWLRVSSVGVLLASLLLLVLILRHDFTNQYVYSYSSRSLPLHYLVSTFYAGQEGSFLFWALCAALVGFMVRAYTSRRGTEAAVMTVLLGVQAFLLLLVLAKSPFRFIWEVFPGVSTDQVPADGRGLNPLLQNFWMVFHPPVLFLGFAAMAVPFSFAVAGLWKKRYALLAEQAIPWVLAAVATLAIGIMLGAYWAYGVLGWGGYWGWDPVENSSLVPWVTGIALLHTLLAQRRSEKYLKTNVALAVISFLLVIYSTFLTRSGILGDASVHSFVDPGATVYWLLILCMILIAGLGLGLLVARRKDLTGGETATPLLSRESALGAGTIVMLVSALVILFGTTLPIFSTIRVEPSFYDTANFPIAVAMALLIGFSLYIQWVMDDGREILNRSWKALAASAVSVAVVFAVGIREWTTLAFVFAFLFALFVNLEVGLKIARGDPRMLGGKIAHAGVALFFLGVIASGRYNSSEHVALPLNTPKAVLGYTMTYVGYRPLEGGKYAFDVKIQRGDGTFKLSPVMFEAGEQGLMRNPDIASSLTRDVYISPVSVDQMGGGESAAEETYTLRRGESASVGQVNATFVRFDMPTHDQDAMANASEGMIVGSVLELQRGEDRETIIPATLYRPNSAPVYTPAVSRLLQARVKLVSMNIGMGPGQSTVTVSVQRSEGTGPAETLIVEASVKPLIGCVWAGTLVLMLGFIISILKRSKDT